MAAHQARPYAAAPCKGGMAAAVALKLCMGWISPIRAEKGARQSGETRPGHKIRKAQQSQQPPGSTAGHFME